jgi:hypothetical protein
LEHPAWSDAWPAFARPGSNGWQLGRRGGWTAQVEQCWYGHRARKATWLYAYGVAPPPLRWGRGWCTPGADPSKAGRGKVVEHMAKRERLATPDAFRDLLLSIARSARAGTETGNG